MRGRLLEHLNLEESVADVKRNWQTKQKNDNKDRIIKERELIMPHFCSLETGKMNE
jgi:hypothetical protein